MTTGLSSVPAQLANIALRCTSLDRVLAAEIIVKRHYAVARPHLISNHHTHSRGDLKIDPLGSHQVDQSVKESSGNTSSTGGVSPHTPSPSKGGSNLTVNLSGTSSTDFDFSSRYTHSRHRRSGRSDSRARGDFLLERKEWSAQTDHITCSISGNSSLTGDRTRPSHHSTVKFIRGVGDSKNYSSRLAQGSGPASPNNLCQLQEASGLAAVPIHRVIPIVLKQLPELTASRSEFFDTITAVLKTKSLTPPDEITMHALFEFFDTNENETVDLLELLGGFSQMCRGTHDERVLALFKTFDRHEQGEFNMDDFMGVMCFVYRCECYRLLCFDHLNLFHQSDSYNSTVN
eukprot:GHVN01106381.1.p1 GENE.GHVN01106381.1~~GHVN01106381.1.p1  ORF type:complete len:346 (-),score=38.71 GHVN01106381.1:2895-3932(-)